MRSAVLILAVSFVLLILPAYSYGILEEEKRDFVLQEGRVYNQEEWHVDEVLSPTSVQLVSGDGNISFEFHLLGVKSTESYSTNRECIAEMMRLVYGDRVWIYYDPNIGTDTNTGYLYYSGCWFLLNASLLSRGLVLLDETTQQHWLIDEFIPLEHEARQNNLGYFGEYTDDDATAIFGDVIFQDFSLVILPDDTAPEQLSEISDNNILNNPYSIAAAEDFIFAAEMDRGLSITNINDSEHPEVCKRLLDNHTVLLVKYQYEIYPDFVFVLTINPCRIVVVDLHEIEIISGISIDDYFHNNFQSSLGNGIKDIAVLQDRIFVSDSESGMVIVNLENINEMSVSQYIEITGIVKIIPVESLNDVIVKTIVENRCSFQTVCCENDGNSGMIIEELFGNYNANDVYSFDNLIFLVISEAVIIYEASSYNQMIYLGIIESPGIIFIAANNTFIYLVNNQGMLTICNSFLSNGDVTISLEAADIVFQQSINLSDNELPDINLFSITGDGRFINVSGNGSVNILFDY